MSARCQHWQLCCSFNLIDAFKSAVGLQRRNCNELEYLNNESNIIIISYICFPKETLSKYKLGNISETLLCHPSVVWIIIPLQGLAEPGCTQFESILTDCFAETLCCVILCEGTAEQGSLTTRPAPAHRIMFPLSPL